MTTGGITIKRTAPGAIARLCAGFRRCRAAAISPMFALLLIPISGSVAMAVEVGGMYYIQRSMQNAADAAALAAATNNSGDATTGTTALIEARAAAKPYGYVDGANGATVTAGETGCPTGVAAGATCYEAVLTSSFPLSFSRVVGFLGTGGSGSQLVSARAVATAAGGSGGSSTSACIWALNHLQTNGTPNADLTGCSVLSSGTMGCTGQGVHADYAIAAGNISGRCADDYTNNNHPNSTIPSDPYAALASNIPTTSCGTNPPTSGSLSGKLLVYCGNVSLSGNLTLTSPDTVVVIKNGTLDLNNRTLSTAAGASATIIFETNRAPFGDKNMKGTINIKAPDSTSSSPWKGVAIYRKPGGPTVDATLAGSKATWQITGLVYFPNTDVTISGAVNHSATGATCFVLVGYNVTINGNGQIMQTTDGCNTAGLEAPPLVVGGGPIQPEKLVL